MRRRWTLPFVLLLGGLPGCGASVAQGDAAAAELAARSTAAEATRERARLVEIEARLVDMERRLTSRMRACEGPPEPRPAGVANPGDQPATKPLRSEGDFLAEARTVTPGAAPAAAPVAAAPVPAVAVAATPQSVAPASEQERLEQLLEGLRAYALDPHSGLSRERREALRVLLRRERKLDLLNPWRDY
jgi:hypothetical protein